jgi:hypothetical protein
VKPDATRPALVRAWRAAIRFSVRNATTQKCESGFCSGLGETALEVGVQSFFLEERAMGQIPNVTADQLTRALGEAVIRIWSSLPQDVQNHLFQEAVTSQKESIRSQLAVFLHDKHPRTSDPLGKPREMMEPDSLGG